MGAVCDVYKLPMSAVYRREGGALRRYERRVCKQSSAVMVTTEREAALLREISPSAAGPCDPQWRRYRLLPAVPGPFRN